MPDSYLFRDQQSGSIKVGLEGEAQTGKYVEKRNEFLERNANLQQSLWAGRDSDSMSAVKNSYAALNDFMNEEIPQDRSVFAERRNAIESCYDRLISNCEEYIKSHKHPITPTGKTRKAMVTAILSNARLEKISVTLAIEKLSANIQPGMIWGNLFGEMKENVDMCAGIYSEFDTKFPEEETAGNGSRTMELARVISAASVLKEISVKGKLVQDMTKVWAQNNITPELKKEYVQFRAFITRILVHDYKMILAHRRKSVQFCGSSTDAAVYRQFAQMLITRSENYTYYKALRDLADLFGEDPSDSGVEGEEAISTIVDSPDYFDLLNVGEVQIFMERTEYYRRVNARSFLQGFVDDAKLDPLLGENVALRQTAAIPYDMIHPTPQTTGTEKLDTPFDGLQYVKKTNSHTVQRSAEVQNEEGETTQEKWRSVKARINERHGETNVNNNILAPNGATIRGLNTNRVFGQLTGVIGGNMTPAQIEALYDKLLARCHIGEDEGQLTADQAQTLFDRGMDELIDIYLTHLRRMEATYGRLIAQMHPEDICRQFGEEYYQHMAITQDSEQISLYLLEHGDKNSTRVREFIMLSDYFMDIFNRSFAYFPTIEGNTPDTTYEINEAQDPVRALYDIERYSSVKGPAMTGAQKRKYNENLKKRFHKMGGNWDLRLFGEFLGVKR